MDTQPALPSTYQRRRVAPPRSVPPASATPVSLQAVGVTSWDVLSLQRTVGNRQTGQLLVQRIKEAELKGRGARIREMAKTAPERGVNLWQATHKSGASVHLLGTHHGHAPSELADNTLRKYLVEFLTSGGFTDVYTEMPETVPTFMRS